MRVRARAKLYFLILAGVLVSSLSISAEKPNGAIGGEYVGVHCASQNGQSCCTNGEVPNHWCVNVVGDSIEKINPKEIGRCWVQTVGTNSRGSSTQWHKGRLWECPSDSVRWNIKKYPEAFKKTDFYKKLSTKERKLIDKYAQWKKSASTPRGGKIHVESMYPGGNGSGPSNGTATGSGPASGNGSGRGSSNGGSGSSSNSGIGSGSGSAQATGSVTGSGSASGTTPANGTSVATGSNSTEVTGSGSSIGTGSASGSGTSTATGGVTEIDPDTPVSTGTAAGTGGATSNATSNGTSNGSGTGKVTAGGTSNATGSGTSNGTGGGTNQATGTAGATSNATSNGTSNGSGTGKATAGGSESDNGTSNSTSNGSGTGLASGGGSGSANGTGGATAQGTSNGTGAGRVAGNGTGTGNTATGRKNVKALSITGGSTGFRTKGSFYKEAKSLSDSTKKLGIKNGKFLLGPDGKEICYTDNSASVNERLKDLRRRGLVTPPEDQTCQEIYGYMASEFFGRASSSEKLFSVTCNKEKSALKATDLGDFDYLGEPEWNYKNDLGQFVTGPSNEKWATELKSMGLQPGDHLLLSINGAGDGDSEQFPGVFLSNARGTIDRSGDSKQMNESRIRIDPSSLKQVLQSLRGITVHLDVMSDRSGTFLQELSELNSNVTPTTTQVCGISDTNSETFSFENNPLFPNSFREKFNDHLGTYGNQLEAMACSMAEDSITTAKSTLDEIVKGVILPDESDVAACVVTPPNPGDPLSTEIDQINQVTNRYFGTAQFPNEGDTQTNALRTKLMNAYKEKFVGRLTQCMKKERSDDRLFKQNVAACKEKMEKSHNILEVYDGWFAEKRSPLEMNAEAISNHLRFIKNAKKSDLEKYQRAFCCLSFDLGKGTGDSDLCGL